MSGLVLQNADLREPLRRDLASHTRRLSRLEGRGDAARARAAELTREVSLAKARLDARPEVELFLEGLQAEASRRSIQSFETLLTALVQEVLPGEKPVSLELSTERGAPALDIGVARPDGSREDILEDNGGALTNVVGMALRLIAVVKAGVGRFLALDEADCWIAPDRVPSFYRVLEDSAARLGVQCLVISHHDVEGFGGSLSVSRVTGEPATGVGLRCPAPAEGFADGAPGFRHIRLVDVQGFKDATLTLAPGVNALVGPNNRGKSTLIRALRAVFYAEARDSLVRAGAASATVELGVAGGRTLRFVRQPRRTPVNLWSLHEADGSVVEEGGARLETGGRATPDWVERLFGIVKVEGLDVHVAHQKFPVFLLGESPSRRSAVLSIGQEGAYIRDMQALHKERCRSDAVTVRKGEAELGALQAGIEALGSLPEIAQALEEARAGLGALDAQAARLARVEGTRETILDASARLAEARRRAEALRGCPEPVAVAELAARLGQAAARERLGSGVLRVAAGLRRARARLALLAELPAAAPICGAAAPAENALARLRALSSSLAEAEAARGRAAGALAGVRAEMDALVAETGGVCPACGGPADAEALLQGHHHGDRAAA